MATEQATDKITFKTTVYGEVLLHRSFYQDGGAPAMTLIGIDEYPGEQIATLTVNIPGARIACDEFLVKTWSENEQIAADALASGLFEDTGRRIATGYVEAQVWKLKAQETQA